MFNDLIKELNNREYECFAYADDLAIIDYDNEEFKSLKVAIKVIERWVEKNDMDINKKKSGIIFHSCWGWSNRRKLKEIEGYPIDNKYKYLGIWIDSALTFNQHMTYLKTKIKKGMKIIYMMKKKNMKEWRLMFTWMCYV